MTRLRVATPRSGEAAAVFPDKEARAGQQDPMEARAARRKQGARARLLAAGAALAVQVAGRPAAPSEAGASPVEPAGRPAEAVGRPVEAVGRPVVPAEAVAHMAVRPEGVALPAEPAEAARARVECPKPAVLPGRALAAQPAQAAGAYHPATSSCRRPETTATQGRRTNR